MKVLQINLHHSKAASAALLLRLAKTGEEIILVQEPWVHKQRVCGLQLKDYNVIYLQGKEPPRACILVNKKYSSFTLPNFCDRDNVCTAVQLGPASIWFMSSYMAHDTELLPPRPLQAALLEAAKTRTPVVIGADANAHHTIWGSTDTNERGESLIEYILGNNLQICNRGNEPTFITSVRQEVLDITLTNEHAANLIRSWKVSQDHSMSDHRYLEFDMDAPRPTVKQFRNKRNTDWAIYKERFSQALPAGIPDTPTSRAELDQLVDSLTDTFNEAMKKACPVKTVRGKPKPAWWSSEISDLRKQCRKLFNEAKKTNEWGAYKAGLNSFKKQIRLAKFKSWSEFCSNIDSTTEGNRLRKIISSNSVAPSYLSKPDGTWTTTDVETVELLVDTHFPGQQLGAQCEPADPKVKQNINPSIVTSRRIEWAIAQFQPYKSPGKDDITPVEMQVVSKLVIPWLEVIYKACLSLTYVPNRWKEVKVVFIPKGGKQSHSTPKDYRPISLSSFLLKTLERLVDSYIRDSLLGEGILSQSQHAYCKGRSVETALHELVLEVEKSLDCKEYSLIAFSDIEGAFNNIIPSAVTGEMESLRIDKPIIEFISHMLCSRRIHAEISGCQIQREVSRGTPQGGVLSPLLWTLTLNGFLQRMEKLGIKVVAYADDIAIMVSGKFPGTLSDVIQGALNELEHWCNKCGLGINPAKTELVLFTRKHKIPSFRLPNIGGQEIKLSERARYLGLILDRKLLWSENIEERVKKATVALYTCRRTIGKQWGLRPSIVHWLYTTVVRPTLMYGSLVWWPALCKEVNRKRVGKVQRLAAVLTTGCLKTTPTKALEMILHLTPLDLYGKECAASAALRLNAVSRWPKVNYGHSKILKEFNLTLINTDYTKPTPMFDRNFTVDIPSREKWTANLVKPNGTLFYTDGSKLEGRVGSGVFSESPPLNLSFRLPEYCSVFQAEMVAINEAAKWVLQSGLESNEISILSDSQAVIKSLNSVYLTSKAAIQCREALNELATKVRVNVVWVPGHRDITGNCMADELARAGTKLAAISANTIPGAPIAERRSLLRKEILRLTNLRWREERSCTSSRQVWPELNLRRTKDILSLSRNSIGNAIAAITGHWLGGCHAARMGILEQNDFCRSCRDEEEEETMVHLLCHCPALSRKRFSAMGQPLFDNLSDLQSVGIKSLMQFINSSYWFSR